MEGLTLLIESHRAGLQVHAEGDQLVIRGPRNQAALAKQLLACKSEIMNLLDWPLECLEAQRRTGRPCARLYPLIGRAVATPSGIGTLVNARSDGAEVLMDGEEKVRTFDLVDVRPAEQARGA